MNLKSDGGQHDVVLTDAYAQAHIPSEKTILIELPREFQELWRTTRCCSQLKRKSYMVKPKPHAYGMKSCEMVC